MDFDVEVNAFFSVFCFYRGKMANYCDLGFEIKFSAAEVEKISESAQLITDLATPYKEFGDWVRSHFSKDEHVAVVRDKVCGDVDVQVIVLRLNTYAMSSSVDMNAIISHQKCVDAFNEAVAHVLPERRMTWKLWLGWSKYLPELK